VKRERTLRVELYRYNPEQDRHPWLQRVEQGLPRSGDPMVLDILEALKEADPTLTFRRSCREGVCGSDGINMNGRNGLACVTPLSSVTDGDHLTLRPLPGLPVIRDLVVDMTAFWAQYERIEPYLVNDDPPPAMERLQSPEDRARLDGLYECILCACCTSACPSWWWNPERYVGPAGLLQAYRFIEDSRDTRTAERLEQLTDPFSLFRCRSILNCDFYCPKGLSPHGAIAGIRRRMVREGT